VNPVSETCVVLWVLCTGDDAIMLAISAVKSLEVRMIMGKHRTLLRDRIRKHFRIPDALSAEPRFLDRPDIVPEASQFLDHGKREILIGV
jgi:hypothetical protein